eukprot:scpid84512/ scgid15429/ 
MLPLEEGVLIFDEVKVVTKVMWSWRSQEIYGLAMTADSMVSLHDVYAELNQDKTARTEYVLQFLWRGLSSNYDIMGPYYTLSKSVDSKFAMACVLHSMRLFHAFDFKTCTLVCDGAATNLSLLKTLLGRCGAFPVKASGTPDRHRVPCSIEHPIWLDETLFFLSYAHPTR